MKKKLVLVFFLAFTCCALGTQINDVLHENTLPVRSSALRTDLFTALPAQTYPYFHLPTAIEAKKKTIPVYVSLGVIPPNLRHAVLATEDKRFYTHGAVDPFGILRAAVVNAAAAHTREGGSTISQQVVKNLFLTQDRTYTRKGKELLLALLLEHYYTKDQILELYLNTVYFGPDAIGVHAAARTFFHTAPEQLTLSQCALLAGLVKAPTYYNPLLHYREAKERQKIVLTLLTEQQYIRPETATQAYYTPLRLQKK